MKLKPCPFCGAVVEMETCIGYQCPGVAAMAWVKCPDCKDVKQGVWIWNKAIVERLPHIDAPLETDRGMHPTVRKAIRPIIVKEAAELWNRRTR